MHTQLTTKSLSKLFILLFILSPLYAGCEWSKTPIQGDYQIKQKKLTVSDYSEIEIYLPAEIIYQQFSEERPYLQINTDENIFSHLDIRVENHKLIVDTKPDSVINPTKLIIYTTSTSLTRVNQSSSGNLRLAGEVNSLDLTLDLNGNGKISTDSLLCQKLQINLNGTGNVNLVGTAGETYFTVNGAGIIDATKYFSEDIDTKICGLGKIVERSI
jgi:Protein of unknown function (DUF2807).